MRERTKGPFKGFREVIQSLGFGDSTRPLHFRAGLPLKTSISTLGGLFCA